MVDDHTPTCELTRRFLHSKSVYMNSSFAPEINYPLFGYETNRTSRSLTDGYTKK
jgi:hypothetical protein